MLEFLALVFGTCFFFATLILTLYGVVRLIEHLDDMRLDRKDAAHQARMNQARIDQQARINQKEN